MNILRRIRSNTFYVSLAKYAMVLIMCGIMFGLTNLGAFKYPFGYLTMPYCMRMQESTGFANYKVIDDLLKPSTPFVLVRTPVLLPCRRWAGTGRNCI